MRELWAEPREETHYQGDLSGINKLLGKPVSMFYYDMSAKLVDCSGIFSKRENGWITLRDKSLIGGVFMLPEEYCLHLEPIITRRRGK